MRTGACSSHLSCHGHPPFTTVAVRRDQPGLGWSLHPASRVHHAPSTRTFPCSIHLLVHCLPQAPHCSPAPHPPESSLALTAPHCSLRFPKPLGRGRRKHKASPVGLGDSGSDESPNPKATSGDGDRKVVLAPGVPTSSSAGWLTQGESAHIKQLQNRCPRQTKPHGPAANELKPGPSPDVGPGGPGTGSGCSQPPASQEPRPRGAGVPSSHTLLTRGRHRGGTISCQQIFGTGRYAPNCWAGQGGGRGGRGRRGPFACIPAAGTGSDGSKSWVWLRQPWGSAGLGRRGCYEKRGCSGSGFQGHVRTSDQGHDVRCPQRWLGTPGLPERPKAETFTLALITAASCWHFVRLSHNADPSPAVPLCPGGPAAPLSVRELPLSTTSPQRWQKIERKINKIKSPKCQTPAGPARGQEGCYPASS